MAAMITSDASPSHDHPVSGKATKPPEGENYRMLSSNPGDSAFEPWHQSVQPCPSRARQESHARRFTVIHGTTGSALDLCSHGCSGRGHHLCKQVIHWGLACRMAGLCRSATLGALLRTGLSRLSHRLTGRHRTKADGLDIQWTLTCRYGLWRTGRTHGIDLRIRRLGVRVPPSAPLSSQVTRLSPHRPRLDLAHLV
jgi:hypothetical protein